MKAAAVIGIATMMLVACEGSQAELGDLRAQVAALQAQIDEYGAEEKRIVRNKSLMTRADVSMNARDWDGFNEVHSDDVWVSSPDSPRPTENKSDHLSVVKSFVNAFPDHKIQQPYVALLGEGDYICAVHENGGTFTEPWHLPGTDAVIPPNGKRYTMTMVTIAKSNGEELTEERIIYDMASMMKQLELGAPEQ